MYPVKQLYILLFFFLWRVSFLTWDYANAVHGHRQWRECEWGKKCIVFHSEEKHDRAYLFMPLHAHSPSPQDSSEWPLNHWHRPCGTRRHIKIYQPSPGTKSTDPFQIQPWTMHQNSTIVSSSVGMGPGSGHGQTSTGLSEHVTLIYVKCDLSWPPFLGMLAEMSPLASVHLFSGPKLSCTTSGTGWGGAVPIWSWVTDHKPEIRNKEKQEDSIWKGIK